MAMDDSQFDALLTGVLQGESDALTKLDFARDRFSPVQIQTALRRVKTALSVNPKDAAALTLSGYMHTEGLGGPVDYQTASCLYEKAIALGSSSAMNNRAGMYADGLVGPVDYQAAIRLFEKAIALGNPSAMRNRAVMHASGLGGPVDRQAASYLFRESVALGVYVLSHISRQGVQQRPELENLELASELYHQSFSVERKKGSLKGLRKLAEANCVNAQFYLVLIAILGEGGAPDLTEAKTWFIQNPKEITELLYDEVLRLFDRNLAEKEKIQAIIDFLVKNNFSVPQILLSQHESLLNKLLTIAVYKKNKQKIINALEQGADIRSQKYIRGLCRMKYHEKFFDRLEIIRDIRDPEKKENVIDLFEAIIDHAKNASGNPYQESENQAAYTDLLHVVIYFAAFDNQTVELIRKLVAADAGFRSPSTNVLHYLLSMQEIALADIKNHPGLEQPKQRNQHILAILKIIAKSAHISQLLQPTAGQQTPIELAINLGLEESAKILINPEHDETELTRRNIFRVRHIILQDKDPIKTLRERWPNLDMPLYQEGYPEYSALYLALNRRLLVTYTESIPELIYFLAQATEAKQALQQKFPNGQTILQWAEEKKPQLAKIIQNSSLDLPLEGADMASSSTTSRYAKVHSNLWQQQQQRCATKLGYHSITVGDVIEDNREVIGTDEDPTASFL